MLRNGVVLITLALLLAGCPPPPETHEPANKDQSGKAPKDGGQPDKSMKPMPGEPDQGGPPQAPPGQTQQLPPPPDGSDHGIETDLGTMGTGADASQNLTPFPKDATGRQVEFVSGKDGNVTISGTVTYEGDKRGTVVIDFLQHSDGAMLPTLKHTMALDKPGSFSVSTPKNLGKIQIISYIDADMNGPSTGEPMGHTDCDVDTKNISGLEITITDGADKTQDMPAK